MKELRVDSLTKTYGDKMLFDNISFLIHSKDKIGLIGINGTGKSSLLKILAEVDVADSGQLEKPHDYTVSYLRQDTVFQDERSILELVFEGDSPIFKAVRQYEHALNQLALDGESAQAQKAYAQAEEMMNKQDAWEADTNAKIILQQLGISELDRRVCDLSGGQQKRVALAQVLIQEPDLLLLDEPTNHLDYAAIEWLEKYLNQYRGALVMVTHDRYFLDKVTNRIFELSGGRIHEYQGNYQTYLEQKSEREEQAVKQQHKQKQLYKQELAWMRAGVKARGTKQQARIDRFKDLEHQVKQSGLNDDNVEIDIATKRLGKKVLELKNASLNLNNQPILKEVDLLIQSNERLGITGKNGAGKSSLLNVLAQQLPLDSGVLEIGETVRMAYYTQNNEPISDNVRMIEYLQEAAERVTTQSGEAISVTEMLERFLFPRATHGTLVHKLSGGEQRRLYLLKLLISQPNVLLLDEPTNDLDIDTLTVLEDYLATFNGAVIAVSHDRYFLDKTMKRLLVFKGHGNITSYYGTMSDYLTYQKEQEKEKRKEVKSEKEAIQPIVPEKPKKKRLSYHEKKEWETILTDIDKLETQIEEIQQEMVEQSSDFTALQNLQTALEEAEEALLEKMERWEYLSEIAEE